MSNIKIIMTYSVSLGILPFLTMLSPLGQSIYAASAHTSGYYHGCSDAQISDSSERYINQPEKGPSFHTNEFMNSYHEGAQFYRYKTILGLFVSFNDCTFHRPSLLHDTRLVQME